jgi:hypothetical protein
MWTQHSLHFQLIAGGQLFLQSQLEEGAETECSNVDQTQHLGTNLQEEAYHSDTGMLFPEFKSCAVHD